MPASGTFGVSTGETIRAVKELVSESRLQFLGLLETRVSAVNVSRVQTFLPRWSWFTDYAGPGNRIWIAWDDELLDVNVLDLDAQFIHCRERFSWHNCSEGDRSLWKRLDRLLVNDAWLSQWPNSHYHCLNARTSDHSPLVIRGDTATHTVRTAMYAVTRKLRALKPVFRSLRRKKGDLSLNVKLAAEFLGKSYKAGAKHAATTGENSMAKGWRSVLPDLLPKATARGERRREFLDLRYLRPWARHVVTPDECMELVQSVTREEIKDAFFDIAEDKAPGPDGFSSGFYKAAWPVIGEEVVKAILEFFTTGRLLKQVNTTILALIPKVRLPSLVSDFRPISCCNVLYKVITKIIVQRLRSVLDKMISPSQNAFVPGRSIGDNILLAQEIFSGYNRQGLPMRCALKVDLRKAYDTVEWDFLSAVLHLFGFPDIFIGWIEECVTTPMFSVCINGTLTGSSRFQGVATGGSDVPVPVCSDYGADVASVRIFRHGLDEFAKLSGLHANPQKSQLILSRSAQPMREHLLAALQFQEGHLPLRYLGLPLLASRLSISDCQPLLLKIDSRIKGWDSIQLSFAGRLQLIKSVLMSLNVYWAMAFILPKGVIRAVEKRMRHFLWKGNSAVGYPKVAWSDVCRPMEEGGLGIRDILALNKALMSRHLWNVIQTTSLPFGCNGLLILILGTSRFGRLMRRVALGVGENFFAYDQHFFPTLNLRWVMGIFSIWHDPWHSLGTLIRRFPSGPSRTNIPIAAKLSAVIVDGDWSWPPITDMECIEILHLLPTIHNGNDSILWRGGEFTTTVAYGIFRTPGPIVEWYPLLSGPCKIPRFSFVLWLAILGKLSTMDKPWLSHLGGVCVLCGREVETHEHLFFRCSYSRRCIRDLKEAVRFTWPNRAWGEDITWASTRWKGRHIVQALTERYYQLLFIIFGGNVTKEFFSTVSARAPLLLGLRQKRLGRKYLA
ncbi:UNVERIFIED_CONTAM: putative ribonuclease H protein [Sesamum calycinum]|uniref:Ribonuclease H protein n=1 Tax=Sesamum calycinum TaxID=2727403 RepID=A0AAW2JLZ0_9LAMI